jgi:hypothetical protein
MTMGSLGARIAVLSVAALFVFATMLAADKIQELQARFDQEADPVHKAKLLEKLGDVQFVEARKAGHDGDYSAVGLLMEKYRDNVRIALEGLEKKQQDAEKHPEGYKQMQFHVDKALRELDQILVVAPGEYKPPLRLVRRDLVAMNDELLRMLFPRRPGEKAVKPPAGEKQP